MQIRVDHNFDQVARALATNARQVPFALAVALNRTAQWAETDVRRGMRINFDKPTPYFLRSLRVIRATKSKPEATLWFKDSNTERPGAIVTPHIFGGNREIKPMEWRLQRAGLLPQGWKVVPGGGANFDAFGNMSRGQISQMLNVLGTFKEDGYNKANEATRERLAKGSIKRGIYGFEYFVNPINSKRGRHLLPGVYKRVATPFGSSLKPVIIFVSKTFYKQRLDFFNIVQLTINKKFPEEFDAAFSRALATARQ